MKTYQFQMQFHGSLSNQSRERQQPRENRARVVSLNRKEFENFMLNQLNLPH